jgi:hypothetical protein
MTASPAESRRRLPARFWGPVTLVFTLQVALVFWLSDHSPMTIQKPAAAPVVRLSGDVPEVLLALEDPTLFVLPHEQGFSGAAWMEIRGQPFHSKIWTEPPRWFPLPTNELGAAFARFVQTNSMASFQTIATLEPTLTIPELPSTAPISIPSRMRIGGELAKRRLLSKLELPAWTNTDLLTNSVVQLVVNARGYTVSAILLRPGSGSDQADAIALQLAKNARFDSIEAAGPSRETTPKPDLAVGIITFEWQTLPPTNGLPAAP